MKPTELKALIAQTDCKRRKNELVALGCAPALATDCDETLWKLDISNELLRLAVAKKSLLPAAQPFLAEACQKYGIKVSDDIHGLICRLLEAYESGELLSNARSQGIGDGRARMDFFACCAAAFSGQSVLSLKSLAREAFEQPGGFRGKIFAGISDILETAREAGLPCYAVSASSQWMVEIGAEYVGIPPWRVAGVTPRVVGGVVFAEVVPPITYGQGKVEAFRNLAGGFPLIALGDAVDDTDRELLDSAFLRVAVEPNPERVRYVVEDRGGNWRILDFESTADGTAADTFVLGSTSMGQPNTKEKDI